MNRLDPKAVEKVNGPAWDKMRWKFETVSDALLAVSPTTIGELTTIYVKYSEPDTSKQPYAVVWIKKASEIILGLSLPENILSPSFVDAPKGCKYAGLTKYVVLKEDDDLPESIAYWAKQAYDHVRLA
jgi:hypothetical protein